MTLPFPLVPGHYYGPGSHPSEHTGRDADRDGIMLMSWKRVHNQRHQPIPLNPYFDGPTQRAVMALQNQHRIPATGYLTLETWTALWRDPGPDDGLAGVPAQPSPPPTPPLRGSDEPDQGPTPVMGVGPSSVLMPTS